MESLPSRNFLISRRISASILVFIVLTNVCGGQKTAVSPWSLLEAGLKDKSASQRAAALRVLGLIPNNPHPAELAEKALKDRSTGVRAAAATALGQMHASAAAPALKLALNDKELPVVMAAAHALHLLNDPDCYEVYYEFLTGERKDDSSMVSQELKVLRDPKQVAQMGLNEGIGFVPFAGIPWEAYRTISKDKKGGLAARAALISALGPDPDPRANEVLVQAAENKSWVLRIAALEAIAKRGDTSLLPRIEPRLSDPRSDVRYAAAATMIHLRDVARENAGGVTKMAERALRTEAEEPELTSILLPTGK